MPVARAVLAPVAVAVLMGGRRDGALVAANIAGRIRVIVIDVRGLVLDAFFPIRAVSIRAFVPVARTVLAPVTVAVLMGGWRGFSYRNRQLLRIAARAVGSLDGKFGGAVRSRRAADLAGIRVQAQTGRQNAVSVFNAPSDGRSAVGGQGVAVDRAYLAVWQGVRGDGGRSIGGIDRHRAGGSEQTVMCGGGNDSRPACHGGDNAVLGNRGGSLVVGGPAHLFVGGVLRRHGGGQGLAPAHIKGDAALVQRYAGDRDHFVVVINIDRFLRYVSGLVGRDKLICAVFIIRSAKRN